MPQALQPEALPTPQAPSTVEVFDIRDPTAVTEGFDELNQDVIHLAEGRFHGRRVVVRLPSCVVVFHWAKRQVRSRTTVADEFLAFLVAESAGRGSLNGISLTPETLIVASPGTTGEFVVGPAYRSITIMIPPSRLEDHLRRRGQGGSFEAPSELEARRIVGREDDGLFKAGERLTRTAARHPKRLDDHESARVAADIEMLDALMRTLASSYASVSERRELTRRQYRRIVELAEKRAMVVPSDRPYVADLCDAANVSERTLQKAFRETLGLTPTGFLKRVRLHGARKALREAGRQVTTVTDVATEWGFWHFGEFARDYKQCFGELPSQTLRSPFTRE